MWTSVLYEYKIISIIIIKPNPRELFTNSEPFSCQPIWREAFCKGAFYHEAFLEFPPSKVSINDQANTCLIYFYKRIALKMGLYFHSNFETQKTEIDRYIWRSENLKNQSYKGTRPVSGITGKVSSFSRFWSRVAHTACTSSCTWVARTARTLPRTWSRTFLPSPRVCSADGDDERQSPLPG